MSDGAADTSGAAPESYVWPLVAIVAVVLPQLAIPRHDRVGPPLLVPVVEGLAFLITLAIAAKPGPVPAGARPTMLVLFGVLAVANAVAAARLVVLVILNRTVDGAPLTADRLLIAGVLTLG